MAGCALPKREACEGLGFARVVEALCLRSHWQRECFRQNICERLRRPSGELTADFGWSDKHRSK